MTDSPDFKSLPILDTTPTKNGGGCGCDHGHEGHDHAAEAQVIASVQDKISTARGKEYWRSLDELSDTPEFRKFLAQEFPTKHELWMDDVSRRDFLKLMGAGISMMFFAGCRKPTDLIFPYNETPEHVVPGKPLFYATALPFTGYAQGALIQTHEGKPTKVEGNPQHPDSLGASDVFMLAEMLNLYDPDRSQAVMNAGIISSWDSFLRMLRTKLQDQQAKDGAGLRILTGNVTSPSLAEQIRLTLKKYPKAKWHQYEPFSRHSARAGARLAFGDAVETRYAFDKANVIVSLDADFLFGMPGKLRHAREFIKGRNLVNGLVNMNRLYMVEPSPSVTGSNADHRLPLKASDIEGFTRALARQLGVESGQASYPAGKDTEQFLRAVVRDLQANRGRSIVIAGDSQPPIVHALAHAINQALGNAGTTVVYTEPVEAQPVDQLASITGLVEDMQAKRVDLLLVLGGNPVFDAPADLEFAKAMNMVETRVHLGLYQDETAQLSHWHINEAHPIETWSDLRATDGTVTIAQPMIETLYGGRTASEILSVMATDNPASAHDIVKGYWERQFKGVGFTTFWKTSVHDGVVAGTALSPKRVGVRGGFATREKAQPAGQALEVVIRPDPSIWDGRYANNGWLQELPKPLTKLTWDNAALISPATADRLSLKNEDVIEISAEGRSVRAPVWITPGHADDSVTLHAGYGRTASGRVGTGQGVNAYALRTADAPSVLVGAQISKTGDRYKLACTQVHHSIEGRGIVRTTSLADYQKNPQFAKKKEDIPHHTLYDTPDMRRDYAWAMSIDLQNCIGCNACVIGCQSENNIAVVGKDQVLMGREMHWIRIDTYHDGAVEDPRSTHQPMLCVHCENAPCEPVCPVGATVHSDEGINEMVYNRCIGTRYCSNNCPYKVRRFNFFQYADYDTPVYKMLNNPNVTVRQRGVMEKCTYCIQRINMAKFAADKEGRLVRDGEIVPACQQACPTSAIVFGDLNNAESAVSKLKAEPREYPVLGDLGVRPRTTYLARVRNTSSDLPDDAPQDAQPQHH
jgi:molybdopterin-containing oxidoreductase family iron-sulfur binding subunit